MRTVQFTLRQYLNTHGLSAYRLAQAARGRVSERTVYALARGEASRVDLGTLGAVITTLEELTGEPVSPGDLLTAVTVPGPDPEARAWLDGDASRLGEFGAYDWDGADPYALGEPVRFGPDGELVIGGE
ncbi:helix-turn-helix transcriptional regulator [Deinococcus sp. MIMF12]|uniref:Helix-turn-helix transcriptional regulator n=1 Tax=Deinococcus rhizophilus TaxID=3049544 RepID=A0ABT7JCM5_9DEIO|nr:helix-turn-helix transcriptional regulator [Deinococcus rhizophilus]MDL2342701.1 helix-turn-helix transcriptional regulator [Deinococcus rhizophilus]